MSPSLQLLSIGKEMVIIASSIEYVLDNYLPLLDTKNTCECLTHEKAPESEQLECRVFQQGIPERALCYVSAKRSKAFFELS